MIKLFRRFRQKLLAENQFYRYLLYALGEIVLVVIGILIALQINNWNEARKLRAEETETLRNVRADFNNAIYELEENNAFRERIMTAIRTLYRLINNGRGQYSRKRLDSLMSDLFLNPTYNGQSETLNILFNSGKINIIRNDSIKNALVLWPQQVADITEDEIYASDINFNDLQPLVKSYVPLRPIYENLAFRNFSLISDTVQSPFPADYDALFRDRLFEGTLSARELTLSVASAQTEELVKMARELVRLIDREIREEE